MNETLQTIKNRYSCRSFTGESIEKEKISFFLAVSGAGNADYLSADSGGGGVFL